MTWKSEDECIAIPCGKEATHTVTMKVCMTSIPEFVDENRYCLDHALYFAAWLPYCYPGEQELVSINPPAKELFNR